MNKLDKDYKDLLKDILENGTRKSDRTKTGTISVFGRQIRHKMSEGFPLITTKKMFWNGIVTELIWFLRGDTNIKFLVDNDCHIWDGDAYQSYCNRYWELGEIAKIEYGSSYYNHETNEYEFETYSKEEFINYIKTNDAFAKKWGELGPIYGKQWRSWKHMGPKSQQEMLDENTNWPWKTTEIDQITNLINDLKTNPDSRRLMVSAWNVGELDQMVLPPCHYGFQVYTRELSLDERMQLWQNQQDGRGEFIMECLDIIPKRAISLMWNQRSVDTFLGLPFNIASYGLLLEIIAKTVNMVPDELIGNLGDTHLYSNHVDQALEQIGRYLRVDERVCMCYENPSLDLTRIQEGMSDSELEKVCDEFGIPTRTREPMVLPKLNINTEFWPTQDGECGIGPLHEDIGVVINNMQITDFEIIDYKSHGVIKAPLSN
jgi:thymidylate synthase